MKFFLILFLISFPFLSDGQRDTIGDPNSGYPFRVSLDRKGFENEYVLAREFSGESYHNQTIYDILLLPSRSDFEVFVVDSLGATSKYLGPKKMQILQPGDLILVKNRNGNGFLTHETVRKGENYWKVMARLIRNQEKVDQKAASLESVTTPDKEKTTSSESEGAGNTGMYLMIFLSLAGVTVIFILARKERAMKRKEKEDDNSQIPDEQNKTTDSVQNTEQKSILEKLLKGHSIDTAGPPHVIGGIDLGDKNAINELIKKDIQKIGLNTDIFSFSVVTIKFKKDVQIFYKDVSVVCKPVNHRIPYLMVQTTDKDIFFYTISGGNYILNKEGQPLKLGYDFYLEGVMTLNSARKYVQHSTQEKNLLFLEDKN